MKSNYFLVGAFIALSCFAFQANAQVLIDGINYDTITIHNVKVAQVVALPKDGSGNDVRYSQASITIPATVELYNVSYPVKKIGDNSLRNNNNLTSLTLPEGLEIIGNSSLAQCESLPSLVLPSTVNSIEDWSFYGDKALTTINFPEGVPAITEHTFQQTGLTSVTLPASCTSLKVCAFQDCHALTSINLDNVTEIVDWSLYGTALTSVTVNNVLSIGDCAFASIPSLASVTLNNCGEISNWCFQNDTKLASVTLNGTELIGSGAFSGCSILSEIRIPSSVVFIDAWAFEKTAITKIYASWNDPTVDVAIDANAFGSGDGKINFTWYVPGSVYYNWSDFFMTYLVDLESAIKNVLFGKNDVHYNAGILNLNNIDGYLVTVISVDGRSVSNFVVKGNNYKAELSLNKGIYVVNAIKDNTRAVCKFIVQ